MWPDILWAGVALAGVAGSGITFRFAFPNEAKRLGRFLEVEISSRLPHPEQKVTVEEAVLFEREVSLKWWDEEFRKLSTATDPMALAARNGWLSSHEVRQIQYGDMSFSAQSIYNATTARISEGGWQEPLELIKKRFLSGMAASDGVTHIPRSTSVWLREGIASSTTRAEFEKWAAHARYSLKEAQRQKQAESRPNAPDCPDRPNPKCECECEEYRTYADSQYIRTAKCFHCKLEERPQVAGVFREVLA